MGPHGLSCPIWSSHSTSSSHRTQHLVLADRLIFMVHLTQHHTKELFSSQPRSGCLAACSVGCPASLQSLLSPFQFFQFFLIPILYLWNLSGVQNFITYFKCYSLWPSFFARCRNLHLSRWQCYLWNCWFFFACCPGSTPGCHRWIWYFGSPFVSSDKPYQICNLIFHSQTFCPYLSCSSFIWGFHPTFPTP